MKHQQPIIFRSAIDDHAAAPRWWTADALSDKDSQSVVIAATSTSLQDSTTGTFFCDESTVCAEDEDERHVRFDCRNNEIHVYEKVTAAERSAVWYNRWEEDAMARSATSDKALSKPFCVVVSSSSAAAERQYDSTISRNLQTASRALLVMGSVAIVLAVTSGSWSGGEPSSSSTSSSAAREF